MLNTLGTVRLPGIGQAEKGEPGFGQGTAGDAMRYRASFADGSIENFITSAVLQSPLREDPRFYQSGTQKCSGSVHDKIDSRFCGNYSV